MVAISTAQAWLFPAFVLPGVISMCVFLLLVPQIDTRLKGRVLEAKNWIANRSRTGWDAYFGKAEPEGLIMELPDGRRMGGVFGSVSFAGRHPDPGHLHLQDRWELGEQDGFAKSKGYGVLLRPDDYKMIYTLNGGSAVGR